MEDAVSCSSRGSAESSPSRSRKRREKVEVFHEVLRRLRNWNDQETSQPGFEDELWAHFAKLPLRYALDVNIERAQDVLMHKNLLDMAHYQHTKTAVEVRLVQVPQISDGNPEDSVHSTFSKIGGAQSTEHRCSSHPPPAFGLSLNAEIALEANKSFVQDGNSAVSGHLLLFRPLYEITISTLDKPKLLNRLTSLLSEIGLNIQEAHAFSTTDGYSLDVFVVDGWGNEDTNQLRDVLLKKISKIESGINEDPVSPKVELGLTATMIPSSHVDIPSDGSEVWEIDTTLLKFEYKVASGSTSDLYKGSFCSQEVAIKVIKVECLKEDIQRDFAQEVYILRKVRHRNVVQFIGACTKPPLLCIITEFMSGGSVYDFLHKNKGVFKLPAILRVAIDVSRGMSYLHHNNIIHRDLKAANLLMDKNLVVKVADFGVARVHVQSGILTSETGTYRWMAPEVIGHRPYDRKADVFSFGIVLWELLTGKLPYEHLTPLQAAVAVAQKGLRPTIPMHTHPTLVELLERCWEQDPSLRPEFSEILHILQDLAKKVVEEEKGSKRRSLGEP